MTTKQALAKINRLKDKKPDGWKKKCRDLLKQIRRAEDPYGYLAHQGNELSGRSARRGDSIVRDESMD